MKHQKIRSQGLCIIMTITYTNHFKNINSKIFWSLILSVPRVVYFNLYCPLRSHLQIVIFSNQGISVHCHLTVYPETKHKFLWLEGLKRCYDVTWKMAVVQEPYIVLTHPMKGHWEFHRGGGMYQQPQFLQKSIGWILPQTIVLLYQFISNYCDR